MERRENKMREYIYTSLEERLREKVERKIPSWKQYCEFPQWDHDAWFMQYSYIKDPRPFKKLFVSHALNNLLITTRTCYGGTDNFGDDDGVTILEPALYELIKGEEKKDVSFKARRRHLQYCLDNYKLNNDEEAKIKQNLAIIKHFESMEIETYNRFERR